MKRDNITDSTRLETIGISKCTPAVPRDFLPVVHYVAPILNTTRKVIVPHLARLVLILIFLFQAVVSLERVYCR